MERCDVLGSYSEEPDRLTRPFGSHSMRQVQERVAAWITEAGMTTGRDHIGNLRGRYDGITPDAATILLGSHLDTVRDAGKYDGPLGVMVAIAAVQRLHDAGRRLPLAVEVLAFADEEGLRFGSTYLGSRAVAGRFDPDDLARTDVDGTDLAAAIRAFGGDPERLADDRWQDGDLVGYCEVHIEQGPVLEARAVPVGVVTAIAGQARYRITFTGEAGHAGTVPMDRRRDALAAAAELVLAVEAEALAHEGLVATVGQLTVSPGAVNVVPGQAIVSLDIRHPADDVRASAAQHLLERAREIGARRKVEVGLEVLAENPAVPCAPHLASLFARAVQEAGLPVVRLPSGAGHDSVAMSALGDIAMLLVRCRGGVSHSPLESVTVDDVAVSIDVLSRFLELLSAERRTA